VDRCADGGSFQEEACSATHCSEVEEWTAGTCLDPRAPGPFGAGVRVVTYTKPSVVNPANDRVLDTIIWYPTADAGTPTPQYEAILDASVDGSGGPYPVVLFSHGSCGIPNQSNFLTPLLATHGFIVVSPPHPGNQFFDPGCGSFAAQVASVQERPQDMKFVLDQILAADLDPGSDFFGLVDETAVAMTGHSFGGLTTYLTQAMEPRITAAVPMAPAAGPASMLTVPSLQMIGQIDSVVNNDATRNAYANSSTPKQLVEIRDAGHYAFSNPCFSGCNPPVTLSQDEAHDAVLRYIVPFLHTTLYGNAAWAPLLEAPPSPTFDVASEP
jgi:predicted dienelactone hydrolase